MEILNEQQIFQNEVDSYINGEERFVNYSQMTDRMGELIKKAFKFYSGEIAEQIVNNIIAETQRMTRLFEP